MRPMMLPLAVVLSALLVLPALAGNTGTPQPAPQDPPTVQEPGQISQEQQDYFNKREEAKKRRDELLKQRDLATEQGGGVQSLDQQLKKK